ncbi:MAG: RiPP maturation radical SAM C-methyltransferase [Acidobacteriota bacterium]
MPPSTSSSPPRTSPISGFDLATLRQRLAQPGEQWIRLRHTLSLLAPPLLRQLDRVGPGWALDHVGDAGSIPGVLASGLGEAGITARKVVEALDAEIRHLMRGFLGLTETGEARLRLRRFEAGESPELPAASEGWSTVLLRRLAFAGDGTESSSATWIGKRRAGAGIPPRVRPSLSQSSAGAGLVLSLETSAAPRFDHAAASPVGTVSGDPSRRAADVVLVSMPFAPLLQPSLGLSLLQAALPEQQTKILYFTQPLARQIGVPLYQAITDGFPHSESLLGEWLFSPVLFDHHAFNTSSYCDEVLRVNNRRWVAASETDPRVASLVPEATIDDLLAIRQQTSCFVDACVDEVLRHQPQVVGLTSVFQQHIPSLALARRLRQRAPQIGLVLGGANCEGRMGVEVARQFDFLDGVVSGEGEAVWPTLVERLLADRTLDGLPGVYTSANAARFSSGAVPNAQSTEPLDDLPTPHFDDFFEQWHAADLGGTLQPRLLFESARGCWWGEKQHCVFCGLNGTSMAFRSKSAERALNELVALRQRYPGRTIAAVDNILDMRYFRDLLPRLADYGGDFDLFYEVKANLRKDQIHRLAAAGIRRIQPGIESLSDAVLALMRKGVTALQNIQLLKWCQELGVFPSWNLLWGFPGEAPEEYAQMADLMPLLTHLPPPIGTSRIQLERFSPGFFDGQRLGFANIRPLPAYRHLYPLPAAAVHGLAYYFAFDYRDDRDVKSYTRDVARQAVAWQQAHGASNLYFVDQGERLLVLDSRPIATQPVGLIEGPARALYKACDSITSIGKLAKLAAGFLGRPVDRDELDDLLRPLMEAGWLLRHGERCLSLAIGVDPHSMDPPGEEPDTALPQAADGGPAD